MRLRLAGTVLVVALLVSGAATQAGGTPHGAGSAAVAERLDDLLRSADPFEVERFPQLTFVSHRMERSGDRIVVVGGLQWNRVTEAVQVVDDEVRIELDVEARPRRQQPS
jgi:hypothetical protein